MVDDPRSTRQRITDTQQRLRDDLDLWVATSGDDGPWLVPLSFLLDEDATGLTVLIATDASTRTGRNAQVGARVRLGLGEVRDLAMIDGTVTDIGPIDGMTDAEVERYLVKHNNDPRSWADTLIRIRLNRIQAWREENELKGRTIMRRERWVES